MHLHDESFVMILLFLNFVLKMLAVQRDFVQQSIMVLAIQLRSLVGCTANDMHHENSPIHESISKRYHHFHYFSASGKFHLLALISCV